MLYHTQSHYYKAFLLSSKNLKDKHQGVNKQKQEQKRN